MGDSFGNGRPPIPAGIRRRVLVEAGHRCAIPTCRYIEVDVHHIIPWSRCNAHEYDNLIALCPNCHRRADKGEIDRKSLKLYKTNLRFAHDKFSQVEIDLLFDLKKLPAGDSISWLPVLLILIRRIHEAKYISVLENPSGSARSFGMQISPVFLVLTDRGRQFLNDIADHEL